MANTIMNKRTALSEAVGAAIRAAYPDAAAVSFVMEKPKEKGHGDYATNAAMLMAKAVGQNPRAIAQSLCDHLDAAALGAERIEIAGPGFINFYLKPDYLYQALYEIEAEDARYGAVDLGRGRRVMVEFVSANPTGPMHMGNARGGALGDTLASVLDFAGWDVTREFYINDAGAQIDKFARSLDARFLQILHGEDSVSFPEDGYQGDDIRVHAQNYIDLYGTALDTAPEEERRAALVEYALALNIEALRTTLEKYRIFYDVWFRESSLHESGYVAETIELLKKSGITYENEGALWIRSQEFGAEKDDVLVRANGIPTYFAADIAYHRNKIAERGFDLAINIWGADHHGHIARMKGAMEAIGIDPEKLHVITIQLVRLMHGGEVARMSKRTGKMITLSDLIEEIGIDAARFFFNMRAAGSHMDFDMDLALKQNNENPVFYVQYAYARISSIIRLLEESGTPVPPMAEVDTTLLSTPEELELLAMLAQLPEEIRIAAQELEPSRLTHYLMTLSGCFHSFYNACRVRDVDASLQRARLKLIASTRTVLRNVLTILGVSAPESM